MPFQIVQTDILLLRCDAIVNPTDEQLSGSGGLDAQIHRAAGPALRRACNRFAYVPIGTAVITDGFLLNCDYVIHTVAPWYRGWTEEKDVLRLRYCYRNSLELAEEYDIQTIAFPLIGSGTRRFPKELVLRVAVEEISRYLASHDMTVYIAVHDKAEFVPDPSLSSGLKEYIASIQKQQEKNREKSPDSSFLPETKPYTPPTERRDEDFRRRSSENAYGNLRPPYFNDDWESFQPRQVNSRKPESIESIPRPAPSPCPVPEEADRKRPIAPGAVFKPGQESVLDESFSQMVLRKIDEKGFARDSDCYRKANIDKRLFSKIRGNTDYHPKKTTAVALAIALELSLSETNELLNKAGYTLSHSILFDLIIEYCILQKNYNIYEINELLFENDQPLLGA